MESSLIGNFVGKLCGSSAHYMRRFLFQVLSSGPIPNHVAFILDGNRRFARKWELGEGNGHKAGFLSLMCLMKYCSELGIKYITIYAFSIDNFNRKPHEVRYVMDLMLEKIQGMLKEENIVRRYGVRVYFIGKLELLEERVRTAAEMAMKATENNNKIFLLICVCYTSTNEIVHSAEECCKEMWTAIAQHKPNRAQIRDIIEENGVTFEEKLGKSSNGKQEEISKEEQQKNNGNKKGQNVQKGSQIHKENGESPEEKQGKLSNEHQEKAEEEKQEKSNGRKEAFLEKKLEDHGSIKLADIERNMYMGLAPDVDILVRTSGETRLSNFLSWQTWNGLLYSPEALWPEIGLPHLVWAVLNFQKAYPLFEKRKKHY